MSVKRFEEQVRDSMEELKFSPSQNVWAGVVSELDKRRKRRIAYWWIPLGLLLVGSVYLWNQSTVGEINQSAKNEKENVNPKGQTLPAGNKENNKSAVEPGGPINNSSSGAENINTQKPEPENSTGNSYQKSIVPVIESLKSKVRPENDSPKKSVVASSENFTGSTLPGIKANNGETGIEASQRKNQFPAENQEEISDKFTEHSSIKIFPEYSGRLNEIKTTLPLSISQPKAVPPVKSVLRNWSYGLNVSVGVAGIYDRNLIRQTDANSRSSTAFLPGNLSSIVYKTAVVEPGAFYAIGGFIEKPVGKLFNLSAGLNYTRYNSKVNVGAKISRSTTIFPGTQDNQDVSFYYSPDPKATYQMHHSMIEVPLTLRFSHKTISANAGITGSTLLDADMLAFDARSGVYYKEKDKLNRFQFGLTGGFDVTVLKRAKYPMHIGPVFRYQVSDITSRYSDSRHLISAAINARIYLQK